jgi:phage tail-like protein
MAESTKALNTIDNRGTIATDPMRVFRFRASFKATSGTPFDNRIVSFSGGFSQVSGLNTQILPITYREGGYNTTVHQIPGMAQFSPITLTRGMLYGNDGAITWMRGLFAAAAGDGLNVTNSNFRCNVKIFLMDHPNADGTTNTPQVGFYVHNAWIQALNFTDLNAGANELMFESMTLVHEGLSTAMINADGTPLPGNRVPNGF